MTKLIDIVKHKIEVIDTYETGLKYIIAYLSSDKFQGIENNYVNPADIILRIREIQSDVIDMNNRKD